MASAVYLSLSPGAHLAAIRAAGPRGTAQSVRVVIPWLPLAAIALACLTIAALASLIPAALARRRPAELAAVPE